MVMTMLEARVEPDKWAALEAAFRTGTERPEPGIVQAYLAHNSVDSGLWRLMAFWSSREALDRMRSSGETPRGVRMFRAAGVEPVLSIFDVAGEMSLQR
jgi:quinol monooxygenase YgiN